MRGPLRLSALLIVLPLFAQVPYHTAVKPLDTAVDVPANRGAAAAWQALLKLRTRASLIMITAHPDDEDGGMLAWESRGRGTRVSLLCLNRGEGGANVMSADFFDALGLVRTMELIEASRRYGVELHWTPLADYGFSKTKEEALGRWTQDRVLYDVVRVIRTVRPLVITSVFVGGPTDGHGNHQVAGQIAADAFRAAGDPAIFPDQIKAGLRPWKPLKHYARVPFSRRGPGGIATHVSIPSGTYDPLLGMTYQQLAREGLGMQKSQTGGPSLAGAVSPPAPYHRYGSTVGAKDSEASFFDGVDTSLEAIAPPSAAFLVPQLKSVSGAIEQAIEQFDARRPERSAPALAHGMKALEAAIASVRASSLDQNVRLDILHELDIKRAQFNHALVATLALSVTANVAAHGPDNPMMTLFRGYPDTFRLAVPGQRFNVAVSVANRSGVPVQLNVVELQGWPASPSRDAKGTLAPGAAADLRFAVEVPQDIPYTRPHFTRPGLEQAWYDIHDERLRNESLPPYPLTGWAEFEFEGARFRAGQVVQTTRRVTGLGTVSELLAAAPAISVELEPRAGIVPLKATSFPLSVRVRSNAKGSASGIVRLTLPDGWRSEPERASFASAAGGAEQTFDFRVVPDRTGPRRYEISATASLGGAEFREGYRVTGYPGLRPYFLYRPAMHRTTGVDVSVAPGIRVGYVTGTGDEVPAALAALGVKTSFLSSADLAGGDLSAYQVIVLGVRAYAARDDVKTHNKRLLDFVQNGGTLIVQYNTPEFDNNYGPYPYVMGPNPEEVTDERSRIEILEPGHQVFTWPNRITQADFEGWVEERGSKFLKSWDARYTPLLATQDTGQEPQRGGLLAARYGKGVYVYNAYALYRQLPEGVPGAYRLLANLISLSSRP